jgi:hypothetical protein
VKRHLSIAVGLLVVVGCQPATPSGDSAQAWSRHRVLAERPLGAVLAAGDHFIALNGRDDDGRASMWSSPDGLAWEQVGRTGPEQPLVDVVAGGPGFVALPSQTGPVWTSVDGLSWSEGPPDPDMLAAFPMAAAEREGVLVVVGRSGVLLSRDGLEWQPVGLPGGQGVMHDVAATDTGFVAVGSVSLGSMEAKGAVWISSDGETWTRVPDAPDFDKAELFRVAASSDRVVATGYANDFERGLFATPMAWTSVGGGAWHRATVIDPFLPERPPLGGGGAGNLEGAIMGPVVRTADGWVSAGQAWVVGEGYPMNGGVGPAVVSDLGIWTSTDGTTWRRVPPHRRFELGLAEGSPFGPTSMVVAGDGVIVYGADADGTVAWISPARPDGMEPPPRPTPLPSPSG